jgi:hypothetical protein
LVRVACGPALSLPTAQPPFLNVLGEKKESKENPLDSSFQKPSEG